MFDINNITILIAGLIAVSIAALFLKNEYIATTVIGGLIGYLSKDVNLKIGDSEVENPHLITYTNKEEEDGDDTA